MSASRPIAEGLFTEVDGRPRLVGSRCGACGVVTFPHQHGCPRCGAESMEPATLAGRGTVWTWTTQEYPVKEPYAGPSGDDWRPFVLGYVDLDGEVRVETHLVGCSPDDVHIGMEVELVLVPFRHDADGTEVLSYGFRPTAGAAP